jgi:hypothetical protein
MMKYSVYIVEGSVYDTDWWIVAFCVWLYYEHKMTGCEVWIQKN